MHRRGKWPIGCKRHLDCDTVGLCTVLVTAASVSDTAVDVALLSRIAPAHPRIRKAWLHAGYHTTVIDHGTRLGIDVPPGPPDARGQSRFLHRHAGGKKTGQYRRALPQFAVPPKRAMPFGLCRTLAVASPAT